MKRKRRYWDLMFSIFPLVDSLTKKSLTTGNTGQFTFTGISFGYYKLAITYIGLQPMVIDSIHFRAE